MIGAAKSAIAVPLARSGGGVSRVAAAPALYVVLALTTLLLAPTSLSLLRMWNAFGSRFYTHGDLVVIMAMLLLAARHPRLKASPWIPSRWAMWGLLPLSFVWLIAHLSTIELAHQMLLPVMLLAVVYAGFGRAAARQCVFPIGFLYFAIPVWGWITPLLQRVTILVVGVALPAVGIPINSVGDTVAVPAGNFEIQGGCAGSMYFIVALAVAAYYGDRQRETARRRVVLLLLAAACALLANWVRVFTIIVAGQLTAMQTYLLRVSHDGFGWAVFAASLVVFFVLAAWLLPPRAAPREALSSDVPVQRGAAPMPPVLAALALLATGPAWALVVHHRAIPVMLPGPLFPAAAGWTGPSPSLGPWHPAFAEANVEQVGTYRDAEGEVSVYVAQYWLQSSTAKLQGSGNGWVSDSEPVQLQRVKSDAGGWPVQVYELQETGGRRSLLVAGYEVGDLATASVIKAQFFYATRSLLRSPPARAFALRAACSPDCDAARARIRRFMIDNPWVMHHSAMPAN